MHRSVRRAVLLFVGAVVLIWATALVVVLSGPDIARDVRLHSAGISLSSEEEVSLVQPEALPAFYPDSRVRLDAAEWEERGAKSVAQRQQQWLLGGTIPGRATAYESMARSSLLDINTLTLANGASVAGWSSNWRYVWPRDSSFTIAALARTGHSADALRILTFLQTVQEEDGRFEARYLPSGTGEVPDDRGIQLDGAGWVLWGARQWFDSFGAAGPPQDELRSVAGLIQTSAASLVSLVDPDTGLPPVSMDYWERKEKTLTLGIAAPILAGLRAASLPLSHLGAHDLAREAESAADLLDASITRTFGKRGYPRRIDAAKRDAAVAFLMPPFTDAVRPDVHRAWVAAAKEMRQPAGGISPGVGWKKDGISWTPETALFAFAAAASGEPDKALAWIAWLDAHRTPLGALPEKVTAAGKPAAVAPIAWTSALVLLTLDELEKNGQLPKLPGERLLSGSP